MIFHHRDLAEHIRGKSILHLNSLGKDAVLTLDWLNHSPAKKIVSVWFRPECTFPGEEKYWKYLKWKYMTKESEFVEAIGIGELNEKSGGYFQTPLFLNYVLNNLEYESFSIDKAAEELRVRFDCDYIASGMACYEGMGRAMYLRRKGLLNEEKKTIYPIGLLKRNQILYLLKHMGVRLNPSYKFAPDSFDTPTYFKMKWAFQAKPEFRERVMRHYPLLALDEYRYEVLFAKKEKVPQA